MAKEKRKEREKELISTTRNLNHYVAQEERLEEMTEEVVIGNEHSGHSYARPNSPGLATLPDDSVPNTPNPKRERREPTPSELQENIVRILSGKINERADGLEEMIKRNTVSIEALKKKISLQRSARNEERCNNCQKS